VTTSVGRSEERAAAAEVKLGGGTGPVKLYSETSTMSTILILMVYALTAISLPVFIWQRHRSSFSIGRHTVVPTLGVLALVTPFIELFYPGQPVPYSVFPYLALATVLAALAGARYVVRRNPRAGASEGDALSDA
jgi:amino acid transporter